MTHVDLLVLVWPDGMRHWTTVLAELRSAQSAYVRNTLDRPAVHVTGKLLVPIAAGEKGGVGVGLYKVARRGEGAAEGGCGLQRRGAWRYIPVNGEALL